MSAQSPADALPTRRRRRPQRTRAPWDFGCDSRTGRGTSGVAGVPTTHRTRSPTKLPGPRALRLAVRWLLLLVTAALLSAAPVTEGNLLHPMSILLESSQVDCYYDELAGGDVWRISFEVEAGAKFLVKAEATGPDLAQLYVNTTESGQADLVSRISGEHKICFHNSASSGSKIVSFNLVVNPQKEAVKADPAHGQPTVYTSMEQSVVNLRLGTTQLAEVMDTYGLRVRRHFYLAEALDSRVTKFALCRLAALVVCSLVQVYSIRRLFDQPSPAAYTNLRRSSMLR